MSQEHAAETPLPLHHAGDDISGGAAPLRQTPAWKDVGNHKVLLGTGAGILPSQVVIEKL